MSPAPPPVPPSPQQQHATNIRVRRSSTNISTSPCPSPGRGSQVVGNWFPKTRTPQPPAVTPRGAAAAAAGSILADDASLKELPDSPGAGCFGPVLDKSTSYEEVGEARRAGGAGVQAGYVRRASADQCTLRHAAGPSALFISGGHPCSPVLEDSPSSIQSCSGNGPTLKQQQGQLLSELAEGPPSSCTNTPNITPNTSARGATGEPPVPVPPNSSQSSAPSPAMKARVLNVHGSSSSTAGGQLLPLSVAPLQQPMYPYSAFAELETPRDLDIIPDPDAAAAAGSCDTPHVEWAAEAGADPNTAATMGSCRESTAEAAQPGAGDAPGTSDKAAGADVGWGSSSSSSTSACLGCPGWESPVVVAFGHYRNRLGYLMSSGIGAAASGGGGVTHNAGTVVVFKMPLDASPSHHRVDSFDSSTASVNGSNDAEVDCNGAAAVPRHLVSKARCIKRFAGSLLSDGCQQLVFTSDWSVLLLDPLHRHLAFVTCSKPRSNSGSHQASPAGHAGQPPAASAVAGGAVPAAGAAGARPVSAPAASNGNDAAPPAGRAASVRVVHLPLDEDTVAPSDARLLRRLLYAARLMKGLQLPGSWVQAAVAAAASPPVLRGC
eukprot:gene2795-3088_t